MLNFFRRHQRYFFFVITIIIIISFSFFGTYNTLGSNSWGEQIAFKAVNGKEVTRFDVDEMAHFLATDNDDKIFFGGAWGPNFLNDGVIRKDFLETGMAQELALAYREELRDDMNKRLEKEKKFKLYSHSDAPFLSVENTWNYFAPQMNGYFKTIQEAEDGLDEGAFNSRVQLYLGEKEIPASTLRYVLRYQEKQYNWLKPDQKLDQTDLSLFGYHTLEDWFGPHFTRLVTEFIINTAILAENQGYEVSKGEALADLVRNTQISYQQNLNNPHLGVASPEEYLNEQLRRLNMDQSRAIKIWSQVLLFRRYFQDASANALVDTLASQKLHRFAHESATIDLYRLPPFLKLATYEDLQKLEVYLAAVGKQNKTDPLSLPQQFLKVSEVSEKFPEMVQKRYVLGVSQVNLKALQAKIALRDLWNWEASDENWPKLTKQFPTLAVKQGKTKEERFEALDALDHTTRSVVDAFAKRAIVKTHPEWIIQGLNDAKMEKMVVGLRMQGGKMPFNGLDKKEDRQEFIQLLDKAPIGETVAEGSPLYNFSNDGQVYYRIAVLDRAGSSEIITFADANADGTLDRLQDTVLKNYYVENRGKDASLYQNESKEWKSFEEVKDTVADQYMKKVLTALEKVQKNIPGSNEGKFATKDQAAAIRFYSHLNKIKQDLEHDPAEGNKWTREAKQEQELEEQVALTERPSLEEQWKLEKTTVAVSRHSPEQLFDPAEIFSMAVNHWSPLHRLPNGDLAFYQVKKEAAEPSLKLDLIAEQIRGAQKLLGGEAKRQLMQQVLVELKDKNALSLAYLKTPWEGAPAQESETMEP